MVYSSQMWVRARLLLVVGTMLLLSAWASDRTLYKAIGVNNVGGLSSAQLGAIPVPPEARKRSTRNLSKAFLIRVERRIIRPARALLAGRMTPQQHRMRSSRAAKRWLSLLHGRGPPAAA